MAAAEAAQQQLQQQQQAAAAAAEQQRQQQMSAAAAARVLQQPPPQPPSAAALQLMASGAGWQRFAPLAPLEAKLDVVRAANGAFVAGGTAEREQQACAWKACFGGCKGGKDGSCKRAPCGGGSAPFPAELKAALRRLSTPRAQADFAA